MKKYSLEELCSVITDGTHQTPEYSEDGYIFLSSKDVTARKINWENTKKIPKQLHETLSVRLKPQINDILLAKNGTTGVAAIVDRDEIFDIYVSLALLRPKEMVYPKYLLYAVNSPQAKRQFDGGLKGIGVPNLHLSVIRKTKIPLPQLGKQQEIVRHLEVVDKLIEIEKEQIAQYDTLIKSRFVEMFGDVAKEEYKYEIRKLGDVANVGSSHRVFTNEFVKEGIPFYRGTEIGELANGQIPKNPYYISKEHYSKISSDETRPQLGDLLMPSICKKGQIWMVDTDKPFYYKDGRVLCISPDRKIYDTKYLQYYMRIKTEIEYPKLGSGSTFAEFKIFLLKEMDILTPPKVIQQQFATLVHEIDKLKVERQKSLEKTQLLFDSLMQQYFG